MALLKTVGLCKYFGGLKAVNHVDMEVQQGQVFGIIGPNGAGKTTFFNLCAGTIPATEGEIWFDGKNITGYRPHMAAKAGIARTFQNIQLFQNTTVLENVAVGFHIHTNTNMLDAVLGNAHQKNTEKEIYEKGAALLERLELGQYKDTLAKNLPYGIQRKVEIARALAISPKILLLDEPAAGMNPNETHELLLFVKKLNAEGLTVVVIEPEIHYERLRPHYGAELRSEALRGQCAGNSEQQAGAGSLFRKTRRTWRNGGVIYAEGEKSQGELRTHFGIERYLV